MSDEMQDLLQQLQPMMSMMGAQVGAQGIESFMTAALAAHQIGVMDIRDQCLDRVRKMLKPPAEAPQSGLSQEGLSGPTVTIHKLLGERVGEKTFCAQVIDTDMLVLGMTLPSNCPECEAVAAGVGGLDLHPPSIV